MFLLEWWNLLISKALTWRQNMEADDSSLLSSSVSGSKAGWRAEERAESGTPSGRSSRGTFLSVKKIKHQVFKKLKIVHYHTNTNELCTRIDTSRV